MSKNLKLRLSYFKRRRGDCTAEKFSFRYPYIQNAACRPPNFYYVLPERCNIYQNLREVKKVT